MCSINLMMHRLRRRDESGFTLLTTLGLLLIATLFIVMMLSVSMNTSTLVQRQAEDAHELRAADGAISAATAFLRDTPPEEVDAEYPCANDPSPPLPPNAEELPSTVQIDGMSVRVVCEELEGSGEVVPVSESGTVTVLADGDTSQRPDGTWPAADETYWGSAPWMTGCALGTTASDCFPWRDAFKDGPMALVGAGRPNVSAWPSMVYSGSTSLKIGGDLHLRSASMGVRDPGTLGPALSVSGDYKQGATGVGSAYYGGCGILADNGPGVYPATRANVGGSFTCSDTSVQGLSAEQDAIAPAYEWTPTLFRDSQMLQKLADAMTDAAADCADPADHLVTLVPGAYNASETAKLNSWFSEGNCDNKTFFFDQGNYWFDVDDPANGNALHFNDSTSNVVFGMPKNWTISTDDGAEPENFPEACDPRAAGASITLSARTTIRHDKGRVAICGPSRGVPAIWQDESPRDTDHVLAPDPTETTSSGMSGSGNARSTGDLGCPWFTWDWPSNWPRAACQSDVSVTYTGFSDGTDPGPGALNSAIIKVVGSHSYANDGPAYTQFDVSVPNVARADGSTIPAFTCRARYFRIPQRANEPLAYDLLAPPNAQGGDTGASENNCWNRFSDRAQLRAVTIVATFHLKTHPRVLFNDTENTASCLYAGFFSGCQYSFSINSLQIIEGRTFTPTGATSSNLANPTNVLGWPNGARADGDTARTLRLTGFSSPYDPPLPTEELNAVGLLLTSQSNYGNGDGAYTNVVVYKPDGVTAICGAGFKRIGGNGHTRYLDLKTTDTNQATTLGSLPRCNTALDTAIKLENAVVDIQVKPQCSSIVPGVVCGWGFVHDWIDLTHASLITTSTFKEPPPTGRPIMHVTVNDDPGATDDALFNVFGTVSLPRTVLDVFWTGPAPRSNAVVEGDDLVVSGIGSFGKGADHEVGVLCCGPVKLKDRKVQLRAIVGNPVEGERLRSEATVTIHDEDETTSVYASGARVTTDEYRICNTAPGIDDTAHCDPVSP